MSAAFHGAKYCWMNGSVIETEKALVSAMEPIYYGIFEGIRAYAEGDVNSKGKTHFKGWNDHMDRLWRSAAVNDLPMIYSKKEILEATRETIRANGFEGSCYIQPRVWPKAGTGRYSGAEAHFVLPVWEMPTRLGRGNSRFSQECKLIVSSWRRIAPDALPAQAKSWANYANSALAGREASRYGYDGAVFLDNRGFVSEGTGTCIMIVRKGKVITPPVTASILESITRGYFIEFIEEDLGIPVDVRDLTRLDLYAADEIFMCGTGGEVQAITSVDDYKIGELFPGPITSRIHEYYTDIVTAQVPKRMNWLVPV